MSEEEQLKNMRNLACVLHSTYFGTLQALKKERGFFAVCELAVKGISDMLKGYFKFLEEKKITDILANLEKTGVYQNVELKQKGNKYIFKVGKCLFAGGGEGVHKMIKEIDMPCPIALFVGSCLAKQNPSKRIYVYPSVYEEEGTITQIDLISPKEYERRMEILTKMTKTEKRLV